ncbi:glycosyltransferase family 52 [Fusobacterium sp. SYSU M8A802]
MKKKHIDEIYLQDHLSHSQYLFNNYNYPMILLEDGTLNYDIKILEEELNKKEKLKINSFFRRVCIEKNPRKYKRFGLSNKIKKIYLIGILLVPEIIKDKVEIIDIETKWNLLSIEKKKEILDIFDINLEKLENLKNEKEKILLITQPLSEDNIISEEEKIDIYSNLLKERDIKKIYIKPYPREKTDYTKVLKNIEVVIIEKEFPIEIFMLLNMELKKVMTLFSTAALNLKNKYDIEFIGTKDYETLYDKFGVIEN